MYTDLKTYHLCVHRFYCYVYSRLSVDADFTLSPSSSILEGTNIEQPIMCQSKHILPSTRFTKLVFDLLYNHDPFLGFEEYPIV